MCQVLYNLVSNAVGFSKVGDTIEINAWREAGMMKFAVVDQGLGVSQEHQKRVFERFESRSHGSRHRGAGLGLSIVKNLVDLHGGTVAFESEPGKGTRVVVAFPERKTGVGAMADEAAADRAFGAAGGSAAIYIPGLKGTVG